LQASIDPVTEKRQEDLLEAALVDIGKDELQTTEKSKKDCRSNFYDEWKF